MSRNMLPSQSSAPVAIRSGLVPSLAQQNAAVTALPPNEIAYSDATVFSSPVGNVIGEERDVDVGVADEKCFHVFIRYASLLLSRYPACQGRRRRQMSSAYSRMARSEENQPMRAVFSRLERHHAAASPERIDRALRQPNRSRNRRRP